MQSDRFSGSETNYCHSVAKKRSKSFYSTQHVGTKTTKYLQVVYRLMTTRVGTQNLHLFLSSIALDTWKENVGNIAVQIAKGRPAAVKKYRPREPFVC